MVLYTRLPCIVPHRCDTFLQLSCRLDCNCGPDYTVNTCVLNMISNQHTSWVTESSSRKSKSGDASLLIRSSQIVSKRSLDNAGKSTLWGSQTLAWHRHHCWGHQQSCPWRAPTWQRESLVSDFNLILLRCRLIWLYELAFIQLPKTAMQLATRVLYTKS